MTKTAFPNFPASTGFKLLGLASTAVVAGIALTGSRRLALNPNTTRPQSTNFPQVPRARKKPGPGMGSGSGVGTEGNPADQQATNAS